MPAKLTVTLRGPFFAKDPAKTFRQNVHTMLEALAAEGEADVKAQYPVVTGEGMAGVVGRVASKSGKPWMLHAVVSETHPYPWANGGQKRYLGGKTEARHHMFRRTAGRIRNSRAVIMADLAEGLN